MKILIIAQHIYPMQTPRANRTTELAKEFAKQGHSVVLYAVLGNYDYNKFKKTHNLEVKNIDIKFQKIPYSSDTFGKRALIDKILGKLFGKLLEFPYIEFMFRIPKIIKNEAKADILISVADPHHIHWGCAKAKLKYPHKFPKMWIADCGDPFMANVKNKFHYEYYSKYEKLFCRLCDYITVPIPQAIEAYYPEFFSKIKVIPQGFDFEFPLKNSDVINSIPTFAYAGIFYKDIRNPKILFEFLSTLNMDFKFIIYTKYLELVLPYVNLLKNKLEIRNPIDRNILIEDLSQMDFLINIENNNSPSQIPSKVIDYAIAGRPILSINTLNFDENIAHEFLVKNYSNRYVVNNLEQYHISNVVNSFLELAMKK